MRILLADDYPFFRKWVRNSIQTNDDLEVIAVAATREEAIDLAVQLQPDVIVLDIRMP